MLCTGCNTCAGGAGNYSCGNSNDGAYIVDPTCGQTKDPNTPVDGRKSGSEGKRFPSLKTGEKRGTCDATTAVVTTSNGKDYKETANGDGGSTRKELDKNGKETGCANPKIPSSKIVQLENYKPHVHNSTIKL